MASMNRRILKFLAWCCLFATLLLAVECKSSSIQELVGQSPISIAQKQEAPEGGEVGDKKQKNLVPVSRKAAGKGKGAYGGANVTRKPAKSTAPTTVARPVFAVGLLVLVSLTALL